MQGRKTIIFFTGGVSPEHSIALLSAQNIYSHIPQQQYEVLAVYIAPDYTWRFVPEELRQDWSALADETLWKALELVHLGVNHEGRFCLIRSAAETPADVIFPVLHGPRGEDGTIQGLAKFFQIPVVGSQLNGSVINIDKTIMKIYLEHFGLPCARYHRFEKKQIEQWQEADFAHYASRYMEEWGCEQLFVKPARMGSSIGINQVRSPEELLPAVKAALEFDEKILIEEGFTVIELEYAVLEKDGELIVSSAAEIDSNGNFYSYQQKYEPESLSNAIEVQSSSKLSSDVIEEGRSLAAKAFTALEAKHYARADLFYIPAHHTAGSARPHIMVNEINTIPGFTKYSMFPVLMEKAGWPMPQLIPQLIENALTETHI